ncbi:MAG: hypothetical protein K2M80_05770 [Muribaculaceae bacterium]|nr:hypothetical protein [Muribaculaceae bacterium]
MKRITVNVSQGDVFAEVAKASDYIGSKLIETDENARDRILMTDEAEEDLSRFWDETIQAVNESLKEMLSGDTPLTGGIYSAELEVASRWNMALLATVKSMLRSFFIASIIGQWFKIVKPDEADGYFTQAAELMASIKRTLYSRRRPTRPDNYTTTAKQKPTLPFIKI